MAKNLLVLNADRPALRGTAAAPYAIQEDAITRSTHNWEIYDHPTAYNGRLLYCLAAGSWQEVIIPPGYTGARFEGYADSGNAPFDATVNGTFLAAGTQANAVSPRVYYDFSGRVPGDACRLTNTSTSGAAAVCDQVTFY